MADRLEQNIDRRVKNFGASATLMLTSFCRGISISSRMEIDECKNLKKLESETFFRPSQSNFTNDREIEK